MFSRHPDSIAGWQGVCNCFYLEEQKFTCAGYRTSTAHERMICLHGVIVRLHDFYYLFITS